MSLFDIFLIFLAILTCPIWIPLVVVLAAMVLQLVFWAVCYIVIFIFIIVVSPFALICSIFNNE